MDSKSNIIERPKLIIYGAGQVGGEFASRYRDLGTYSKKYDLVGFIDDAKTGEACGFPIKGTSKDLQKILDEGVDHVFISLLFDPIKRLEKFFELKTMGFKFPSLTNFPLEEDRYFSQDAKIGEGVLIHKSAEFIGVDFTIGDYSVISAQTVIEKSIIGKGVLIQPGVKVGHGSVIGDATVMYMDSRCVPDTIIGKKCRINIGAIAHRNVPDGKTIGTYDKLRGKNSYLPD
jgi:acetyltransferase-like isoleucine patch superfamily enzyme